MGDAQKFAFPGDALELLFDRGDMPAFDLPADIGRAYAGAFGIRRPGLFANFVSSVDGAVALDGAGESGHVISGDSAADHFVMGLLRACADAVVIGAGTLRASPKHLWNAAKIFPPAAAHFSELRRTLGLAEHPKLVVVTGSGELDPSSPALRGATVVTSPGGEARLRGVASPDTRVIVVSESSPPSGAGSGRMNLAPVVELLRSEGHGLVLTEGGPTLVGQLVAENLLDELFLTVSPRLFGRYAGDARKSLVDGVDLGGKPLELESVRRHGSHLFLRYSFAPSST
jgi:riboflavin biosynthesis pyrimidine reductase